MATDKNLFLKTQRLAQALENQAGWWLSISPSGIQREAMQQMTDLYCFKTLSFQFAPQSQAKMLLHVNTTASYTMFDGLMA